LQKFSCNVFGETTQTRRQLIGGSWMVSETVYDSQGRVTFSTDSHLEGSSNPVYGTKSLYDSQGRSVGSVRYTDCRVTIAADGSSSVTTSGTEIYLTATEYDSKGRVASSTDAYGNTTTYGYDKFDRQIIVKQANGLITETVYNAKGQVEKSIIRFGSEERVTSYKYDEFGNISETTQPDGTKISAKYNNKGQKISETNQLGQIRTFEYDDNGQLIKVTLPEVNGQKPVYEYTYDAQGNQLTIKDPNGHITYFTYDLNGNQLTRTLPDGNSTETFEYDSKGRLLKETSFEGVITTYQYDNYDRLESKTFTQNGKSETWTYVYDEFGRGKEVHQGDRITYTKYNEQGQVEYIETPEGRVSYTYDKFGRQTSVQTDNDTPTEYSYDNFGRLKTVKSDGQTRTFEYDDNGQLVKVTLPDSAAYIYEYDAAGNQTLIRDPNGHETRFTYDENGNMLTRTLPLGFGADGIQGTADDAAARKVDGSLDFIERFEYDKFGRTALHISFEGVITKFFYDDF
jgi:YD repeat-containing protein